MKTLISLFALMLGTLLASCNPVQIEARREGLIPVKSHAQVGTFRLEYNEDP